MFDLSPAEIRTRFFFYKKLGFLAPGLKFAKNLGNLLRNSRPHIFIARKKMHRKVIQNTLSGKLKDLESQKSRLRRHKCVKNSHKVAKSAPKPPNQSIGELF